MRVAIKRAIRVTAPLVVAVALLSVVLGGNAQAQNGQATGREAPHPATRSAARVPDNYIVVYRRSVEGVNRETDRRERRDGFKSKFRYNHAIEGFAAKLSRRQVEKLESDPDVDYVSPDRPVEAVGETPLAAGEPTPPTGVRRIDAATQTSAREASSVNVAVIDTGVDLAHPDLNAVDGKNCVGSGAAQDDNGHGSHVAGTIAAKNNGAGVVGVAPGTKVYAAKVLDSRGSGTNAQVICGIDWATATRTDGDPSNDIAVANMSLGGGGSPVKDCATTTDAMHQAICRSTNAGVTYVAAAGNDGWDFDYAAVPDTPAAYPQVLTVTAISDSDGQQGAAGGAPACRTGESDDRYASFSNYAATAAGENHTIAGPGVCINSTWMNGGYNTISGTSMATPHLAGVAALCFGEGTSEGPCARMAPDQVIQRLRNDAQNHASTHQNYGFTGDPTSPVTGRYYGYLSWAGVQQPDTQPPAIQSVKPSDGASGVAKTVEVKVTFDEAMDKPATERAFSLAPTSDPTATVPGSFSWSANTMSFRPAAPLSEGTNYTATVTTQAQDASGNSLASDKRWSFKTATSVTAAPYATGIEKGTPRSGAANSLASNDGLYYSVNSTPSGTRVASWYGRFAGVPNSLRNLKLTYSGKHSRNCTQTVGIFRWATNSWVTLDSRTVGTTEVQLADLAPGDPLADYVSGTGELRMRIRCTRNSGSFYSSGDLMKVTYDRP